MENFSIVEEVQPAPEKVRVGLESIKGSDAYTHLEFVASDLLEGRDTASTGYDIAAHYVASMFKLWGIKPAGDFLRPTFRGRFSMPQQTQPRKRGYFQNIAFRELISSTGKAVVNWQQGNQKRSRTFHPNVDYTYSASGTQTFTAPVVFVGYGIQEASLKLDEYKGLDVKGKIVMMLSETPGKDDPESPFNKGDLKEKYYPARRMMRRMTDPKSQLAQEKGAVGIIMVENSPAANGDVAQRALMAQHINDERPIYPGSFRRMSLAQSQPGRSPFDRIPTIRVSREMADLILGLVGKDVETLKAKIEETLRSQSMLLSGVSFTVENVAETKLVNSMNVLGMLEGADPELKNEVIVVGAHLDHSGRRGDYIFNGADDNGSGSVGVIEIAEAFAKNPVKPKRSILFALWTGEEKGLLGSRYYVANDPIFPLDKTVACLNMDMISRESDSSTLERMGRMRGMQLTEDVLKKIDIKKYMSMTLDAGAADLIAAMRENNNYVGMALYLRKSETATGGSDHAPFAQKNIPWAHIMAAMTEDYHRPSDSVEKTSPDLMQMIIRLTYLTAFDLADK